MSSRALRYYRRTDPWRFSCPDCGLGSHTLDFQTTDALYLSVIGTKRLSFCLLCFERRLGRKLRPEELPDVPINRVGLVRLRFFGDGKRGE